MSAWLRVAALPGVCATIVLSAAAAPAATVTFDGFPEFYFPDEEGPYVEDGVLVTPAPGDFGSFEVPGSAHLDDADPYTTELVFSMDRRFRAVLLEVIGLGTNFVPNLDVCGDVTFPCDPVPYDNVVVSGLRDGVEIFRDSFYAGDPRATTAYAFPAQSGWTPFRS